MIVNSIIVGVIIEVDIVFQIIYDVKFSSNVGYGSIINGNWS